jgi:hypothetical protein
MTFISHSQISRRETSIGQQARPGNVAGLGAGEICYDAGDPVRII